MPYKPNPARIAGACPESKQSMGGLAWGALGFGVGGVKYEPGVFLERGLMRSCCGLCLWDLSPCLQMFPECIVRRAGSSSCICGAFPERGGKEEEEGVMWVTAVPGAGPALPLLCRGTGKRAGFGVGWQWPLTLCSAQIHRSGPGSWRCWHQALRKAGAKLGCRTERGMNSNHG